MKRSIIKERSKKKVKPNSILFGAYIPPYLDEFISLYTISENISKSVFLRDMLRVWYEDQKDLRIEYVRNIRGLIQNEWGVYRRINKQKGDEDTLWIIFMDETKIALQKRGLTNLQIKSIFKDIIK